MDDRQSIFSVMGRQAVQKQDWAAVSNCATELLKQNSESPEGHFLSGLVEKAALRLAKASEEFATALELDPERYDAAIELANQHCAARRNGEAFELLVRYESMLGNSPLYLDMAGTVYSDIGMYLSAHGGYLVRSRHHLRGCYPALFHLADEDLL